MKGVLSKRPTVYQIAQGSVLIPRRLGSVRGEGHHYKVFKDIAQRGHCSLG